MKNLFLVMMMFLFPMSVQAFEDVILPQQGYGASKSAQIKNVISDEEFSDIEKRILKKTYPNDTSQNRLSRLEKTIFGMEQSGDNYEDRFENLLTAAEYYQDGYRQGESTKKYNEEKKYYSADNSELNSKNYIQNYNFKPEYEQAPTTAKTASSYPKDYPQEEYYQVPSENYQNYDTNKKKPSKIKQFFTDLADILVGGAVTGYTMPMNSYGISPYDAIMDLGGSSYISPPAYYSPRIINSPSYYNSYVPRRNYIPAPRYNYYGRPSMGSRYYPSTSTYRPAGVGSRTYGSGMGVHIIN